MLNKVLYYIKAIGLVFYWESGLYTSFIVVIFLRFYVKFLKYLVVIFWLR